MSRKYRIFILTFLLALPLCVQAFTAGKLPVEILFDKPAQRADWYYLKSANAGANTWLVGADAEYAYKGGYMLYMSQDGGVTRTFTTVAGQAVECLAYCPITSLAAGKYTVDFHCRGPKETASSLSVAVLPAAPVLGSTASWTACPEGLWWQDVRYTFTAGTTGTYYLCFRFYCDAAEVETNTAWAIDAIQLYPSGGAARCAQMPVEFIRSRTGNNSVVTWEGNASEYELEYFTADTSSPTRRHIENITSNTYNIRTTSVPEGTYHFRVRAICERDTSAWASLDYQLLYDANKRCLDYLRHGGAADFGFEDSLSRQAVHHYPHDFDERTNGKLRTFPKNYPASVRLGNWRTGEADTIVYTLTPDMGVLHVHYALVMQLQEHTPAAQPGFTVEFLDENGLSLGECSRYDFTADWSKDTAWHREKVEGLADSVLWRDWSLVGLNMHDYKGQPIQIRLTTHDCSDGNHFGYAYFTLSCARGVIEGTQCGRQPDSLSVDDGFYYRWYHKYDSAHIVLDSTRTYYPNYHPFDSATYCVDMINKIDTNCVFTLEASTLAFRTVPVASATYEPANCRNYVQFYNESYTLGEYYDENQQAWIVKYREDGVGSWYWDFGRGRSSHEWYPRREFDAGGENLRAVLHTFYEECEETFTITMNVPAVGTKRTYRNYQFCEGDVFIDSLYNYADGRPHIYAEAGDYIIDSLVSLVNGCDSLIILSLRYYFRLEKQYPKDTLCLSVGSMEWHGQTLTSAGIYTDTLRSEQYGCDSIIYVLDLFEQPPLEVSLNYTPQHLCGSGEPVEIPISLTSGAAVTYDLLFSDTAKMLGLTDIFRQPVSLSDDKLLIALNDSVWPGPCSADLVFHNGKCDTMLFPISFTIHYPADSLITQRWNDYLAVRRPASDFYGGFFDYQWYKDGERLDGQTSSSLYLPDQGLQAGSTYSVEFTRLKDSIRVSTCGFAPSVQPDSSTLIVTPTIIPLQQRMPVHVYAAESGVIYAYHQSGLLVGQWALKPEENQIFLPAYSGMYLLRVVFDSGRSETRKVIVQ